MIFYLNNMDNYFILVGRDDGALEGKLIKGSSTFQERFRDKRGTIFTHFQLLLCLTGHEK